MQLNKKALGLTMGIFIGLSWLIAMLVSLATGYMKEIIIIIGSLHPFFSYSLLGAAWMAVFHLIVGFMGGWIFAWVYNKLSK